MLATLYLPAKLGHSSTLALTNLALVNSPATSSNIGAIILHGPHHSAQKSTTEIPSNSTTLDTKSFSFICSTILNPPCTPMGYFFV